uniref:Uncharacterized protein n=1 Tax=Arundo donax TaxID=35708 RepID=A0A0A9E3I4_ARUDO
MFKTLFTSTANSRLPNTYATLRHQNYDF